MNSSKTVLLAMAIASPLAAGQSAPETPPAVDIEIAGEIVVVGRRDRNIQQATTPVV